MKKKVAIIGSGIAGLVLASLLKTNSNFELVVYEKGDNLNLEEGFGLQLSVNSVSILNKIGFVLNEANSFKYISATAEVDGLCLVVISPLLSYVFVLVFVPIYYIGVFAGKRRKLRFRAVL